MTERNQPRPRRSASSSFSGGDRPPRRPRGASAEELLELADELEEHARALMSQVRQLQRIAHQMEDGGESARAPRPRAGSAEGGRPQRSQPRRPASDADGPRSRPRRSDGEERGGRAEGGAPRGRGGFGESPRGRPRRSDADEGERGGRTGGRGGGGRGGQAPSWTPPGKRRGS